MLTFILVLPRKTYLHLLFHMSQYIHLKNIFIRDQFQVLLRHLSELICIFLFSNLFNLFKVALSSLSFFNYLIWVTILFSQVLYFSHKVFQAQVELPSFSFRILQKLNSQSVIQGFIEVKTRMFLCMKFVLISRQVLSWIQSIKFQSFLSFLSKNCFYIQSNQELLFLLSQYPLSVFHSQFNFYHLNQSCLIDSL